MNEKMHANSGYDYVMNHPKEIGKHLGKWILIFENKIVVSDENLIKIYKQFKEDNPDAVPFVMKMPNCSLMPYLF